MKNERQSQKSPLFACLGGIIVDQTANIQLDTFQLAQFLSSCQRRKKHRGGRRRHTRYSSQHCRAFTQGERGPTSQSRFRAEVWSCRSFVFRRGRGRCRGRLAVAQRMFRLPARRRRSAYLTEIYLRPGRVQTPGAISEGKYETRHLTRILSQWLNHYSVFLNSSCHIVNHISPGVLRSAKIAKFLQNCGM
jgi:hypothetical protein